MKLVSVLLAGLVALTGAVIPTAAAGAAPNTAASVSGDDSAQRKEGTFVFRPDGTSVEVPAGTDPSTLQLPYYTWNGVCDAYEVCLWTGDHFTGTSLQFGGDYAPCDGFRFEGTVMQDRTNSIWNRASGGISIWNRFSDGSYNYNKYGWLPSGYSHDTAFSKIMDAWAYDPSNNCTRLNLRKVV